MTLKRQGLRKDTEVISYMLPGHSHADVIRCFYHYSSECKDKFMESYESEHKELQLWILNRLSEFFKKTGSHNHMIEGLYEDIERRHIEDLREYRRRLDELKRKYNR